MPCTFTDAQAEQGSLLCAERLWGDQKQLQPQNAAMQLLDNVLALALRPG